MARRRKARRWVLFILYEHFDGRDGAFAKETYGVRGCSR